MDLCKEERPRLLFRRGQNFGVELLKQRSIARQEPAIQQSQVKFCVVLFDTLALF